MLSVIKVSGVETVHCYRGISLGMDLWHQLSQDQSAPHQRQRQETPSVRILFLKTSIQVLAHVVVAKTFLTLHESESFWDLEHLLDMAIHGDIFVLEFRQVEDIY
jgi:hypothetical protein